MNCTRDGFIGSWDTVQEGIQDMQSCSCLCCEDYLDELPAELIQNKTQTTL